MEEKFTSDRLWYYREKRSMHNMNERKKKNRGKIEDLLVVFV